MQNFFWRLDRKICDDKNKIYNEVYISDKIKILNDDETYAKALIVYKTDQKKVSIAKIAFTFKWNKEDSGYVMTKLFEKGSTFNDAQEWCDLMLNNSFKVTCYTFKGKLKNNFKEFHRGLELLEMGFVDDCCFI